MTLVLQHPDTYIARYPDVLGGKAVIAGTRIPVWVIEDVYLEEGLGGVLEAYPGLTDDEIRGAILYAREYGREAIARDRQAYYESLPEHLRD